MSFEVIPRRLEDRGGGLARVNGRVRLLEGLAQPRVVETGIRTETRVQITRGLEPGERVIVSNIPRLRVGIAVEVEGEGNL